MTPQEAQKNLLTLQEAQKNLNMKNVQFAEFLGVSPSWLSSYYHGRIRTPMGTVAQKIIEKLPKVTLAKLNSMEGRGPDYHRK